MKKSIFIFAFAIVSIVMATEESSTQNNDQKEATQAYSCHNAGGTCPNRGDYMNTLNGTCYSSLEECKKADGDLYDKYGNGKCHQCY